MVIKKLDVFIILLFVYFSFFLSTLVYAEEDNNSQEVRESMKQDIDNLLSSEPKNSSGEDSNKSNAVREAIKEDLNNFLSSAITLPEEVNSFFKFLFNISGDEKITLQKFIILIGIFIWVCALIYKILDTFVIFGTGWRAIAASIIIALLGSITGGINQFYVFYFEYLLKFIGLGFLYEWAAVSFLVLIILAIILFIGAVKLLNMIREGQSSTQAQYAGMRVGINS